MSQENSSERTQGMNRYLDVKALSVYLGIKRSTLYAWARKGRIPCLAIHGVVRFDLEAIDRWLEGFRQEALKPPSGGTLKGHPFRSKPSGNADIREVIARVKRQVYTSGRGETRPRSGSIRKEDVDGAV